MMNKNYAARNNLFSHLCIAACRERVLACWLLSIALAAGSAFSEKTLIYDEMRGIIFVDKDKPQEDKGKAKRSTPVESVPRMQPQTQLRPSRRRDDIHANRKKDPPELYFKSGLQYFTNRDYINALKNFTFARTADPQPKYALWMGKTYRQLEQYKKMLAMMKEILVRYPDSDVADDALFEIAFYYQKEDYYEIATKKYAELAEQYPFGVSFSNGEEFLEVSRKQRQFMRAEMVSSLRVLGYEGKTPQEAYKKFQQKNGLKPTGKPNQKTVRAIKEMYQNKLRMDEQLSAQKEQASQGTVWAIVAGAVLAFNFFMLIIIRMQANTRKKHLTNLEHVLTDLDVNKL